MNRSLRRTFLSLLSALFVFVMFGTVPMMAGALVAVSPSSLNFGTQAVNGDDTTAAVQINNTGDADLVVSSIAVSGTNAADFSYFISTPAYRPSRKPTSASPLPLTIHPGSSASVLVDFKPQGAGSRAAIITITTNGGSPQAVSLAGTAANAGISISPTSLTFSSQLIGTLSSPKTVTITNNGAANLVITALSISGTNSKDFSPGVHVTTPGRRSNRVVRVVIPPQGSSALDVSFAPTAAGTRTGTLNITDNASGSPHTVSLTGQGTTPAGHLSMTGFSLGFNTWMLVTASVDGTPASDLTVTATSSDPSKLLLSTDTNGGTVGTSSITGTIHTTETAIHPGFVAQSLASSGTAQITVSAPNYVPATATVTFNPSGFVLGGPNATNDFTVSLGASDTAMSVSLTNLDSALNPVSTASPARLRAGVSVNVPVASETTSVGNFNHSPATITAGNGSDSSLSFHATALGTTALTLGTPDVAGFAIPAAGQRLTATVQQPGININPVNVGYNTQITGVGSLGAPAPAGGLQVTIASSDPAKILLSTDTTGMTVGSTSIILTVAEGQTALPSFVIQGLASSGSATLNATASGYRSGTGNVALTPSGFVIDGGKGVGQTVTTTPGAAIPITVSLMRLDQQNNPVSTAVLRAGYSAPTEIDVPVAGNDDNVGLVFGGGVFHTGDTSDAVNTAFYPQALGQVTISTTQPSGFTAPTSGATLNVMVVSPAISLNTNFAKVGKNLQIFGVGSLNTPSDNDLNVTFTSDNPNVLISSNQTTQGSTSTVVTVPAGKGVNGIGFPTVYIQAMPNATGTATITASVSGGSYTSGSATVTVAPSAFVLLGPNGIGADFATIHSTAGNPTAPSNLQVVAYELNGTTPESMQAVRGGLSLSVAVAITVNPSLGTIGGTPVSFSGGVSSGAITFSPGLSTGVATIKVAQPSGFTTGVPASQLNANVN